MSLDKGMAWFGFVLGASGMMATNALAKLPTFRRPWLHVICGAGVGYLMGSLKRAEQYVLEEQRRISMTWERRRLRNEAVYAQFKARLAEADLLQAEDPALLSHKEDHGAHELKFYRRY